MLEYANYRLHDFNELYNYQSYYTKLYVRIF